MVTPTMLPVDKKTRAEKNGLGQICINSFDDRMLSHDRWLWFFFWGALPGRRCDLVVPADWGWGRSNKLKTIYEDCHIGALAGASGEVLRPRFEASGGTIRQ